MNLISDEKRARIMRYHFEEDKKRSLYGDIIIRTLASEILGIDNSQIVFKIKEYGKPYLEGFPRFHYNISHSGSWIIAGIGREELGVDIEAVASANEELARRFFSEKEYEDMMSKNKNDRRGYFYDLWTLKESYIKCIGNGLYTSLNSFGFELENDEAILFPVNKQYHFKRYDSIPGYKVAVCAKEEIEDKIKNISLK
ncbi:4'-phosphopantetheinyl transferase family protein [Anaeromicropila herbilytica]|nr:4'-phosphopantetheinyl transferase superfamily protein [Anaeromicropila herbilytica]